MFKLRFTFQILSIACCSWLISSSFAFSEDGASTRRNSTIRRPILSSPVAETTVEEAVSPDESVAPIQSQSDIVSALGEDAAESVTEEDSHVGHHHGARRGNQGPLAVSSGCNACNGWGCDLCSGANRRNNQGYGGGVGGPLSGFYARKELLYWWTRGMYAPPLVSTSPDGTARADAGVLGTPGASTLLGGQGLNNNGRLGGRITLGYWLDDCHNRAIEGDFFYLGNLSQGYSATSLGSPILSRPYFDIQQGSENAELVAYPGVLAGTVAVDPLTKFLGAGLRTRWNMCRSCCNDPCDPCGQNGCSVDFTIGYRMLRLSDRLNIREDLTSLDPNNPGSFVVQDQFRTWNTFHGLELGTVYSRTQGLWSVEMLSRMSLGMTASEARIQGSTDITTGGITTNNVGGLLAQRSNIGTYYHESFAIAPELGMTVGYRVLPWMKITAGYSLIYWTNVLRAGHLIDRDVNKDLIPPENGVTGALRPQYQLHETDFWAMGLNVGWEGSW